MPREEGRLTVAYIEGLCLLKAYISRGSIRSEQVIDASLGPLDYDGREPLHTISPSPNIINERDSEEAKVSYTYSSSCIKC